MNEDIILRLVKPYVKDSAITYGEFNKLFTHFEESDEGETDSRYIGDISEYISIFEGLTEYNGRLVGAYCSVPALRNPKIITLNVFENSRKDLVYSSCQRNDFIEIIDEADYINFVKLLFTEPDEIHIRISNYTGDPKA